MKYAYLTSMLESAYNELQAKFGFKKETWITAIKDIKKVFKIECKVTINLLKTKF